MEALTYVGRAVHQETSVIAVLKARGGAGISQRDQGPGGARRRPRGTGPGPGDR
jgi:hypothetical protein